MDGGNNASLLWDKDTGWRWLMASDGKTANAGVGKKRLDARAQFLSLTSRVGANSSASTFAMKVNTLWFCLNGLVLLERVFL
jgi:hypothetical protein